MSDFYLSLPSHSNKTEFPDNTSNHFKIRLPYPTKLEGSGWKVRLSAISLPDPTSQTPKLMENDETLFKAEWVAVGTIGSHAKFDFSAEFRPLDLRKEDLTTLTGVGFMKTSSPFSTSNGWRRHLRLESNLQVEKKRPIRRSSGKERIW